VKKQRKLNEVNEMNKRATHLLHANPKQKATEVAFYDV